MNWQDEIKYWKEAVFHPEASDVLLQLEGNKKALILSEELPISHESFKLVNSPNLKKILREAKKIKKNQGLNSLGVSHGCISFKHKNKAYQCPIFIKPVENKRKITDEWVYFTQLDDGYFNPFLEQLLDQDKRLLDVKNIAEFKDLLIENIPGAAITDSSYLSNFHPHRFILLKELESLEKERGFLKKLNSVFDKKNNDSLYLHEGDLFPLDPTQQESIDELTKRNIVLQGPPGTGKSQVITNVAAKSMAGSQSTLIVSEKYVALQVVQKMFQKKHLDHLCLLAHHQTAASEFVTSLLKSWKKLETSELTQSYFIKISELKLNQLQLLLDKVQQSSLIADLSFLAFQKKYPNLSTVTKKWQGGLPNHEEWEKAKTHFSSIQKQDWENLTQILKYFIIPRDYKDLKYFKIALLETIALLPTIGLNHDAGINDFEQIEKLVNASDFYFYDGVPLPIELFVKDSIAQKTFFDLRNELIEKMQLLNLLEEELKHWEQSPTLSELLSYAQVLSSTNRFNIKERWKKKSLLKFINLDLTAAKHNVQCLIEHQHIKARIIEIQKSIRELGLNADITSLDQINLLINKTRSADPSVHSVLCQMSEEERTAVYQKKTNITKIRRFFNSYTQNLSDVNLNVFLVQLERQLDLVISNFHSLIKIPPTSLNILLQAQDLKEADEIFAALHWKKIISRYPTLQDLSPNTFVNIIQEITHLQSVEQASFGIFIHQQQKKIFSEYHLLLQTPARKLSAADKIFKSELQKGKRILSKAFAKKRVFPSPYELFNSDAIHWIKVLKPVMLFSPAAIAKHLPLKVDSLDLVIMDEAGQIPFAHTLGALFRGKRFLIAGDEQQMSPQKNFRSGSRNMTDILSWIQYYWKNKTLNYHYRSELADLIAFSNRCFYKNQLQVFPFADQLGKKAIQVITTEGKFINRENKIEAAQAATLIEHLVNEGCTDFGVITLSQKQLACISDLLSPKAKDWINEEHHPILYDSLENVQGDQCSHLIISMGYGYNEENNFAKRFGPVNQLHGEKRLNVLMSRARKKITFIRSVRAADFVISENIGVDMLRLLMSYLDEIEENLSKEKQQLNTYKELNITEYKNAKKLTTDFQLFAQRGYTITVKF